MTTAALVLAERYLSDHPAEAARAIDSFPEAEIRDYLKMMPNERMIPVVNALSPMIGAAVLRLLPKSDRISILEQPDRNKAVTLLGQMPEDARDALLRELPDSSAAQLRQLLEYPEGSAGRLMDTAVFTLPTDATVARALDTLRVRRDRTIHLIKLLDQQNHLAGVVDIRDLAYCDPQTPLSEVALPVRTVVGPLDPREDVLAKSETDELGELPVTDLDGHLLGVIRPGSVLDAIKDEATLDIQTMVGASREERALSPSWFALRKRMPWLQINLLTAFLAAAVVGLFESTIATFTALAVLLPVVAGQSGNAGAQALAVTMRGLALREITVGHWFRVMRKEINAGFWNGVAIAVTCSIGVYIWSGSIGLVLVISLSMVLSMVAAGIAGALVPIVLSRLGQDPAVASSIILTTVTDVAGFFSFLGIATALSGMLTAS